MKRLKLARCSGAREDRLSSLPDDILINNVLSLLPMREAQRTSILTRRWRHLWSYLPGLDLDGSRKVLPFDDLSHTWMPHQFEELDLSEAFKYAEWVDRVIDAYRGTATLTHFRVLFRLKNSLADRINSWLEFSLRQGVEVLELNCCDTSGCKYAAHTFPSIEPSRFPNIRLLKSLTLKCVRISSDDDLERLLLACESLETLQLAGLRGITCVSVTGPVSRLKHIEIDIGRESSPSLSITIRAPTPDLVSFRCSRYLEAMYIEHAPRLIDLGMIDARFCNYITAYPLFPYLSQLEALHLVELFQKYNDKLPDFPVLNRLKHLKLDFGPPKYYYRGTETLGEKLRFFASMIEIAPFLQHLTLEVHSLNPRLKLREGLANVRLQLPPVIEIAGFKGRRVDCELATHLIKAARPLEKLIVDCRDPLRRGYMLPRDEYSERIMKEGRRAAKKFVEPELPPKAKLVII